MIILIKCLYTEEPMRYDDSRRGAGRRVWPDGNAPRVGRVRDDVPKARRQDAPEGRRTYAESLAARGEGDTRHKTEDPKKRMENAQERPRYTPRPAAPEELPENLLVGRNPIREALRAGRSVEKLLVANGDLSGAAHEIIRMAKDAGAVVQMVDRSRLDQIYPAHQGMLAYAAPITYCEVGEMLELARERGEDPFLIVLDGITDPHNLGAIIRSAECVGAHGVIIPERRASGLTPAAAKAAAGALDYMKIARVTNLNRTLDELKKEGVWAIGAAMDGESAFTANLSGPIALVIGSEGDGISRLTLEKCDMKVSLPMSGHLDSLNASVAAGVLMYAVLRARKA